MLSLSKWPMVAYPAAACYPLAGTVPAPVTALVAAPTVFRFQRLVVLPEVPQSMECVPFALQVLMLLLQQARALAVPMTSGLQSTVFPQTLVILCHWLK